MNAILRSGLIVAATSAVLLSANASANTFYESASYVDYTSASADGSNEPGAYFIDSSTYIIATIHLDTATSISAIGGYFSEYSSGNIFGAIVSASSLSTLSSSALAEVVFTPTGSDQSVTLSSVLTLAAGDYDIVFGSGLFGATGSSGLVTYQSTDGTPILLRTDNAGLSVSALSSSDVRITVASVPEPSSYAMLLAGLGLMAGVARRRRG
jgi:hypothetical protein